MSGKKRLENISPKGFDLNGNILLSSDDYYWLMEQAEYVKDLKNDLNKWKNEAIRYLKLFEEYQERLLEAERVEELEKDINEWKNEAIRWLKLFEEYQERYLETKELNKRLREALEFYANEETYATKFATDTDEIFDPFTLIELDMGKKARKVLEGET